MVGAVISRAGWAQRVASCNPTSSDSSVMGIVQCFVAVAINVCFIFFIALIDYRQA